MQQQQQEQQQQQQQLLQLRLQRGSSIYNCSSRSCNAYVRFELNGRTIARSVTVKRSSNPVWNQAFDLDISHCASGELQLLVLHNDPFYPIDNCIGRCSIPLGALCRDEWLSFSLPLTREGDVSRQTCFGCLHFSALLLPAAAAAVHSDAAVAAAAEVMVATIQLQEGSSLASERPYVQLQLGGQRCRSRVASSGQPISAWHEQFRLQLQLPGDDELKLVVRERRLAGRDICVGRASLRLRPLLPAKQLPLQLKLLDGAGSVRLLLTLQLAGADDAEAVQRIAGTDAHLCPVVGDVGVEQRYSLLNTFKSLRDVGRLTVCVGCALGLPAAVARQYCTLQLHNTSLRSATGSSASSSSCSIEYSFNVRDIHSALEVCVWEEQRRAAARPRLLGRAVIRLLRLRRNWCWYTLKGNQHESGSGRLLMTTKLVYNPLRAAIVTLRSSADEQAPMLDPMPKFRIASMRHNVSRLLSLIEWLSGIGRFCSSCCSWQHPARSAASLASFVGLVWNLQPHLLPVAPLALLTASMLRRRVDTDSLMDPMESKEDIEDVDDVEEDAAPSSSLLQRLRAAQDTLLHAQEAVGRVAEFGERLWRLADWTESWLSAMAWLLLAAAAVLLCCVPLRAIVLVWGVCKFAKRLLLPDLIDSSELLNFISRLPTEEEMRARRGMTVLAVRED